MTEAVLTIRGRDHERATAPLDAPQGYLALVDTPENTIGILEGFSKAERQAGLTRELAFTQVRSSELRVAFEREQEAPGESASVRSPASPEPPHEMKAPKCDSLKRPARILVVDDIDTNREIVEAYLVSGGYRADSVGSAAEAIAILENESRDLVLMDIQMPVMDGVAATRCIRSLHNAIKDVPIIALTGNVFPDQVRSYLKAGMNGHVGKPIERAKLYNCIQRCLSAVEHSQIDMAPALPLVTVA